MIDLKFLSLSKFAGEHNTELYQDTLTKLNLVEDYFIELNKLASKSNYPKAKIAAAVSIFSKASTRQSLTPAKTHFKTTGLYVDCLSILTKLKNNFQTTIDGTPEANDKLVNLVKADFTAHGAVKKTKFVYHANFRHFLDALKFVWDYDDFIGKQSNPALYNGYRLAKKLGVNTCPYCNRAYTFTVIVDYLKGKKSKFEEVARPEFDHFYSKGLYPFLGISFYNLVPSCSLCNSSLKGSKEMTIKTHCHPYVEGYEEVFNFTTGVTVKAFLSQRTPVVPILFKQNPKADSNHVTRAKATHELFAIAKIYPYHNDIAEELFRRSTEDSKKLIESYWNQVSLKGNYLFPTKDDLYRHFIGNYYSTKDFIKRPLAKFYYDILKETKIISYIKSLPARPVKIVSVPISKV